MGDLEHEEAGPHFFARHAGDVGDPRYEQLVNAGKTAMRLAVSQL